MPTNGEIEMRWIDAWNDIYDIIGDWTDYPCVLPDWTVVDVEQCQGWLQSSVYEGWQVKVESGWYKGHPAVMASRTR